jgi:prepilin-type N-terminal cleavage/methylation domain-containing protein
MKAHRRGFTLVELLVAVGITAVLAAVLLSLVTRTLALWEGSASALMLENEADLILHRLVVDLESAYPPIGDLSDEPWIEVLPETDGVFELRLIVPTASTASDIADPNTLREVTYRLRGDNLFRFERTAAETLAAEYRWATWPTDAGDEFLLGQRVEELMITFTDRDRAEIDTPSKEAWPTLARVELVLLTPEGAQRMGAVEEGASNEQIEQITDQTARTFVQWIAMGGQR